MEEKKSVLKYFLSISPSLEGDCFLENLDRGRFSDSKDHPTSKHLPVPKDSGGKLARLALTRTLFTAAGPLRIRTGFPFNLDQTIFCFIEAPKSFE